MGLSAAKVGCSLHSPSVVEQGWESVEACPQDQSVAVGSEGSGMLSAGPNMGEKCDLI